MNKHKAVAIIVILVLFILLFGAYLLLFSKNDQLDFIPFVLGTITGISICAVKHYQKDPEEWTGNNNNEVLCLLLKFIQVYLQKIRM